ncbi:MAG: sigma factor [Verrucomicrobiota bacterium]
MPESFQRPTAEEFHTTEVQGLFIKYQPVVRSYVLSMTPDFAMAVDVMQETFLVVSRKAASFVIGTSFPAWVKTIARFKTLEAIRASGRQHEAVIDALRAEAFEFPGDVDRRPGSRPDFKRRSVLGGQ